MRLFKRLSILTGLMLILSASATPSEAQMKEPSLYQRLVRVYQESALGIAIYEATGSGYAVAILPLASCCSR